MASEVLKVRPSIKGAARATGFIRAFCANNAIDGETANKLCLAADEILPNVIALCTSPRIVLGIEKGAGKVSFTITHGGYEYDLSDKNSLIWPEQMEKHKITELGLDIIHRYMDKIECAYLNGENITTLTKYAN